MPIVDEMYAIKSQIELQCNFEYYMDISVAVEAPGSKDREEKVVEDI